MTATRWWVRKAARWLARVDGVQNHLRLAFLAMTGVSTATLTLQQYGYGQLAWPLIGTAALGVISYAYFFTEGGVWNQQARDKKDLSTNFSGPSMLMDNICVGIAMFVAEEGRRPTAEEREMIVSSVREQWEEFRDGVEIESNERSPKIRD